MAAVAQGREWRRAPVFHGLAATVSPVKMLRPSYAEMKRYSQNGIDRLTCLNRLAFQAILIDRRMSSKGVGEGGRIDEFAAGERPCVGGDRRSPNRGHQPAVEIQPDDLGVRFARQFRRDSLGQIRITF